MKVAPGQANEQERIKDPQETTAHMLKDSDFEDVCRLAAEVCHTPVTLVSIIDSGRHWFRSNHPLISADLAADFAFCSQAQHNPTDIFFIADLQKDYRFGKHLLVTAIPFAAFYCNVPLLDAEGKLMAVLSIWGNKAHELTAAQLAALQSLSRQVASKIELRKQVTQLTQKEAELKTAYADLENFATVAAHDLKSPLNAIISLTDLLITNYDNALDEEGNEYISFLHTSALNLTELVGNVLYYSRASQLLTEEKEKVNFTTLAEEIIRLYKIPDNATITYDKGNKTIHANRTALQQILMNLLDNALKFNDKEQITIDISFSDNTGSYIISVKDNGTGIPKEHHEKIFELFKKIQQKNNDKGIGIGLAIVKNLAIKLGGSVTVDSEPSLGSTFTVTLPK